MRATNTTQAYGWVSIGTHWLMAVLIFGMFGLGVYMVDLSYMHPWYKTAPKLHISVGMLLLALLLFRLVWRVGNPVPRPFGKGLEPVVALWVHRLHYVWMFALMLSGYLIVTAHGRGVEVFGWFEVPALFPTDKGREAVAGQVHKYLAWGFMGFVALHAAAALKHHVVDKDSTLLRMLGIKEER